MEESHETHTETAVKERIILHDPKNVRNANDSSLRSVPWSLTMARSIQVKAEQ